MWKRGLGDFGQESIVPKTSRVKKWKPELCITCPMTPFGIWVCKGETSWNCPQNRVYFGYAIKSHATGRTYIGRTSDFEARLRAHNTGSTRSTKNDSFFGAFVERIHYWERRNVRWAENQKVLRTYLGLLRLTASHVHWDIPTFYKMQQLLT